MSEVTVCKLDHAGREKVRYPGRVLERAPGRVVLEAFFTRETMALDYVTLGTGDRFVEWYFSDRWYNVFAIHDASDGAFKGWYCNVTRPAQISAGQVRAEDLALDLFVSPEGAQTVLDEDEFDALKLPPADAAAARAALAELQELAARRAGPFAR